MNDSTHHEADIICQQSGAVGQIILNRPQALNALTFDMTKIMQNQLVIWAHDPSVDIILVSSNSPRAFCAGGDIRALYQAEKDTGEKHTGEKTFAKQFFYEEYRLNQLIFRYPKPYISLIDGIVMGGGAGISIMGSVKIASESTVFAMPENGIGLFPDVGAGWFLNQHCPHIGLALALSGYKINVDTMFKMGLATHRIAHNDIAAIQSDVLQIYSQANAATNMERFHDLLKKYHCNHADFSQYDALVSIRDCFKSSRLDEIMTALEHNAHSLAETLHQLIDAQSPISLYLTHRHMRACAAALKGGQLTIEQVLKWEYRLSQGCINSPDFYEGIRAQMIDKDRNPQWQKIHLSESDVDGNIEPELALYFEAPHGGDISYMD